MAEILLSLTIIGVVAAITLPSLTGNINERTWDTQRKALHARMAQALALMGNLNGYGNYTYSDNENGSISVTNDTAARTFVSEGLAKVLKINNICDTEHFSDCGVTSSYKKFLSSDMLVVPKNLYELNVFWSASYNPHKHINTSAVAFETQNGESIVAYYNPFCVDKDVIYGNGERRTYFLPYMCVNFIFDLNGKKGPNTVGKDIWFMSALYQNKLEVVMLDPNKISAPVTLAGMTYNTFNSYCTSINARVATVEELMLAQINHLSLGSGFGYSKKVKGGRHFTLNWVTYVIDGNNGGALYEYLTDVTGVFSGRCIYRNK